MKQSSIEWFAKKVKDHCDKTGEAPTYHQIGEWQKEAKAMHKQEYIDAWMNGQNDSGYYTGKELRQMAQEDYNETFGNDTP